ncbi:MAG TPA: HD domain-containing phosphohydrolase [Thermoleophilaceae bacterium]|nr:HD domain-containing phosphohydrolase [Thermoleophilaceae bacterium]
MELLQEVGSGTARSETHALIRALADSDGETYSHSLQVAAMATAMARRLGVHGEELIDIEFGALLHDIGKLCLPRGILEKPGRLTDAERDLIRMHPEWGASLVESIPGLEPVAAIVRFHHERPDGCGYPRGLDHADIPLAARIVSVCDAYGAMTKTRPYRAALMHDAAIAELERHSGTQFDPDVVDALIDHVRTPERLSA